MGHGYCVITFPINQSHYPLPTMAKRTKYPVSEYKKYRETLTPDEIKKIEGKVVDYYARNEKISFDKFDYWTRVFFLRDKDEKLQKERDRKKAIRDKEKAEKAKADKLKEAEEAKIFLAESEEKFKQMAADREKREANRKEVESANNSKGTISKPQGQQTASNAKPVGNAKPMGNVAKPTNVVSTKNEYGDEDIIYSAIERYFERKKPVYVERPPDPVPPERSTGEPNMSKFRFRSGDTYEQMMEKVKYIRRIIRGKSIIQKVNIIMYYDIALEKEKRGNNTYLYGGKNLKNRKYRFYIGRAE